MKPTQRSTTATAVAETSEACQTQAAARRPGVSGMMVTTNAEANSSGVRTKNQPPCLICMRRKSVPAVSLIQRGVRWMDGWMDGWMVGLLRHLRVSWEGQRRRFPPMS